MTKENFEKAKKIREKIDKILPAIVNSVGEYQLTSIEPILCDAIFTIEDDILNFLIAKVNQLEVEFKEL